MGPMPKVAKVVSVKTDELQELEDSVIETRRELADVKTQLEQLRTKMVVKHWPKGYAKPVVDGAGNLAMGKSSLHWQWCEGTLVFLENPHFRGKEGDDEEEEDEEEVL
jgi:hypothetical protein